MTTSSRFKLTEPAPGGAAGDLAADVRAGLTAPQRRLSCMYFYDDAGSRLFDEICDLPEYYLTRTEAAILREHADEIAASVAQGACLVELGSGSARKTRHLIDALLRRQPELVYVPIDVSRSAIEASARELLAIYPALEVYAICAEYDAGLRALPPSECGARLVLFLGSNIGNFDRARAAAFLARLRAAMTPHDRLLVGVDLRKDRPALEAAYDDAAGVTARFNRNVLVRINEELGADFDADAFAHRAVYDEDAGRVEMHLVATRAQRVRVAALDLEIRFAPGEAIHTEDSYKYSDAEIDAVARQAGLRVRAVFTDAERRFADVLLSL